MREPGDFVLLCHARSGSNLLLWALDQHPGVQMAGEIFDESHSQHEAGLPAGTQPYALGMDGREFLTRNIFPPRRGKQRRARGFKLFYNHARADAPARTAWQYLIDNPHIRVIHLARRNLFDCLVSFEVALRSGEWYRPVETPDAPAVVPPFIISPWSAQEYFGHITTWRAWAARAFADHPALMLDYDELRADFAGTMARICAFIGVAPTDAQPALIRQVKTAPAQQISNYAELRRSFCHGPFESFFAGDVILP